MTSGALGKEKRVMDCRERLTDVGVRTEEGTSPDSRHPVLDVCVRVPDLVPNRGSVPSQFQIRYLPKTLHRASSPTPSPSSVSPPSLWNFLVLNLSFVPPVSTDYNTPFEREGPSLKQDS